MAAESWDASPPLIDRLLIEGYSFEFFQAVRIVLRSLPRSLPPGFHGLPSAEAVRFHSSNSLSFPPAIIESVERHPPRRPKDVEADRLHFVVSVLGLTGYSGVLPWFYSDAAASRKGAPFDEFLNLFNHRLISLEYRAWEKYHPQVTLERARSGSGRGPLERQLFALLGLPSPELREQFELPPEAFLRFSRYFSSLPRSASNLQALLRSHLGQDVKVEQFRGRWSWVGADDLSVLDGKRESTRLGSGALLGRQVWYQQASFRIQVSLSTFDDFLLFLPGSGRFAEVVELINFYAKGLYEEFDLEMEFDCSTWNQLAGGKAETPARLGWYGWLGTRAQSESKAVSPRRVVFRSTEPLAKRRRVLHSALTGARIELQAERKIDLKWSTDVIHTLLRSVQSSGGVDAEIEEQTEALVRSLTLAAIQRSQSAVRELMLTVVAGSLACEVV